MVSLVLMQGGPLARQTQKTVSKCLCRCNPKTLALEYRAFRAGYWLRIQFAGGQE